MAITEKIQLKASYADYTERTYNIPYVGIAAMNYNQVVAKVKAFNEAAATENSSVQQTFLSENGAKIVALTEATINRREETEIYHV